MAIASTMIWEVRVGGSATNGGGFDPAFGGTDYSQQTAAQATGTVTSSTTTVTATTGIFTSAMVGNIITDGTTFVVITAFTSSTIVTVDTAPAWTAASVSVGGASNLISTIASKVVAGNTIYELAGTFTSTTTQTITLTGTAALPIKVVGYTSNRTPYNTDVKPVHTSATNSIAPITLNGCSSVSFYNIRVTSTAASRGSGWVNITAGSSRIRWINCECDGCSSGWDGGTSATTQISDAFFFNCSSKNCTGSGWQLRNAVTWVLIGCWGAGNTTAGFHLNANVAGTVMCFECVFSKNGAGVRYANTTVAANFAFFSGCTFADNTTDGFNFQNTTAGLNMVVLLSNVFYGNTNYGVRAVTASLITGTMNQNAYGGNGTAASLNMPAGQGDITLAADPFTNRASDDYSINNTAGGGAALRAAGFPAYIGSNTYQAATNYLDVGAAQAVASSAVSAGIM